jgi:hypothetical protein
LTDGGTSGTVKTIISSGGSEFLIAILPFYNYTVTMATKKVIANSYVKGVGRRSKKRTGIIVQSIRLLVTDNKMLHHAAKEQGISFNGWASQVLIREATKVMKRKQAAKTEETLG